MYSHIPRLARSKYHREDLAAVIVDINSVRRPDFSVVDAFVGVEGLGPINGHPVPMGLMICGEDPVALDTICARIMGVDPGTVRHLRFAAQRGLGTNDLDQIEISGETIADVTRSFATPLDMMRELLGGGVEITEGQSSLPGCAEVVATAFQILLNRDDKQAKDFEGLRVFISDRIRIEKGNRLVMAGNGDPGYAIRHELTPGCLPSITEAMEAICEAAGL